jgi:hypothetical protein
VGWCRRDQRVRIDRPREIHLGDRFVLKPESCQSSDRIGIAVDAQVDIWKRLAESDNERRRDQRLEFAACFLACFQRGDQACREMRLGISLESSHHRCRNLRRADNVGDRDAVAAMSVADLGFATRAGKGRSAPVPVDYRELSPIAPRRRCLQRLDDIRG